MPLTIHGGYQIDFLQCNLVYHQPSIGLTTCMQQFSTDGEYSSSSAYNLHASVPRIHLLWDAEECLVYLVTAKMHFLCLVDSPKQAFGRSIVPLKGAGLILICVFSASRSRRRPPTFSSSAAFPSLSGNRRSCWLECLFRPPHHRQSPCLSGGTTWFRQVATKVQGCALLSLLSCGNFGRKETKEFFKTSQLHLQLSTRASRMKPGLGSLLVPSIWLA